MPTSVPHRPLVFAVMGLLSVCVMSSPAHAANAADFVEALEAALSPPEVQQGSTIPNGPLLTADNELVELVGRTPEVIHRACLLIAEAKSEILLQVYEWDDDDEAASRVLSALMARAKRAHSGEGEPLRIGIVTNFTWLAENKLRQDKLRGFIAAQKREPHGRVRAEWATHRGSLFDILHSKSLIIDGQRALVMTGNLHTSGGLASDSFNMGAIVAGPIVSSLRDDWRTARAVSTRELATSPVPGYPICNPDGIGKAGLLHGALLSRRSNWTYWGAGDQNPQARGIVALFDTATEQVDLINPSLGAKDVQAAIVRGIAERGLRVRALLSLNMNRWREKRFFGGDNVDTAYALYAELLELGGPELADRLTIVWGAQDGRHASPAASPGNVHAKVASFDGQCLLIGSTNFNWLSWNNGRELSIALTGLNVASEFVTSTYSELLSKAAPMRATDLPEEQQSDADPVAAYLRSRGG